MFRILCTSLLLAAALPLSAAPLPPARAAVLRDQFQARQRETKTWSATFTQTVAMPGMREPVVSGGTMIYRAPDQMRLDFKKPEGEYVLALGDVLFVQKAGKKVAQKSLSDDRAGKPFQSLIGLLKGAPMEEEAFYNQELTKEGGRYVLVLDRKPDASSRMPKRITNIFEVENFEIREVLVELPNGGTLQYRFEEITRNRTLDAARFSPPAPR
jgi:outer membrane lipoprotein carrier protein